MDQPDSPIDFDFACFQANLRIASGESALDPLCPVWIGFVNQGSALSESLANEDKPADLLNLAMAEGLADCPVAIFSRSLEAGSWMVHLTRDLPVSDRDQNLWLNQITQLVNQMNPKAVGFSLPNISLNIEGDSSVALNLYEMLMLKAIHALIHTRQINNFYIFSDKQDSNLALNYLLELKSHLTKAKISSFVFH